MARRRNTTRAKDPSLRALSALAFSVWGVFSGACVYFPSAFGSFGSQVSGTLVRVLGWPAYLLPAFFAWSAGRCWYGRKDDSKDPVFYYRNAALPLSGFVLFVFFWSVIVTDQTDIAGVLGSALASGMQARLGWPGALVVSLALLMAWARLVFGVPWGVLALKVAKALAGDWQLWKQALKESIRQRGEMRRSPVLVSKGEETVTVSVKPSKAHESYVQKIAKQQVFKETSVVAPPKPNDSPKTVTVGAALPTQGVPVVKSLVPAVTWKLPPLDLLLPAETSPSQSIDKDVCYKRGHDLVHALSNFDVHVELGGVVPGPVVTRYDLVPQPGVKVGEIESLAKDIALSMRVAAVRILGPIAGRGAIGIEVPNAKPMLVKLREILEDRVFSHSDGALVFALGRAASGDPATCDLADMPHILVAGATNSGKSVLIHAIIASLLYRMTPDELKLVLIDPKRLELPLYDGIPHIFDPRRKSSEARVITDSKEAARTIHTLTDLMDYRYELLSAFSVRNIEAYNEMAKVKGHVPLPFIVVIIDELADLILTAVTEIETDIQRLAQMARAVGIHLVLATQRPSVNVITGVIKANLPARVALQVVSKVDSRVILDSQGAEDLLGAGDMLYLASGAPKPARLQGAYVSDEEIKRIAAFWSAQGKPEYADPAELLGSAAGQAQAQGDNKQDQENLKRALELVMQRRRVSQDLLKAHFGSSARATDLLSRLEVAGFITKPEGTNRWEIHFDQIEDFLKTSRS
ncbi:MAG: DNA translocase FtsK 4TM domain-containing protein [Elusimicrobiota bacterium]